MPNLSLRLKAAVVPILLLAGVCPANSASPGWAAEYARIAGITHTTTVVAASQTETVAWVTTRQGDAALWVAKAPGYQPRQLLTLTGDTGDVIDQLSLSPDGRWLAFSRGPSDAPNGRVPNAAGLVNGPEDALWLVATDGGEPQRIAAGARDAAFSPDSAHFVVALDHQVLIGTIESGRGLKIDAPRVLFKDFGAIDGLTWSPAGDALAFTSARPGHGLVGVFRLGDDRVHYVAPSIHRDVQVSWSPDGGRLAFLRLPGIASGEIANVMTDSRFAVWVADAAGTAAAEIYRSPGFDANIYTDGSLHWLKDGRVTFLSDADGYSHLYAVDPSSRRVSQLSHGHCDEEAIAVNAAADSIAASGNCFDQDRREVAIWTIGADRWNRVSGHLSVATDPAFVGSGNTLLYRSATYDRAQTPAVTSSGKETLLAASEKSAPASRLPEVIHLHAPDGTPLSAIWFAPDVKPGHRAAAVVYVHGGPIRQMMPAWHPNAYYTYVYAANQLLAQHGIGVLAINYRTGVGFGRAFRNADRYGPNGLSELQDVIAAGEYLRVLPGIDPDRIGIYGGSYGGHLAANALARRSDLFKAGVIWHGIYDFTQWASNVGHPNRLSTHWGNTEATRDLAFQSSAISQISTWRSPVLLIAGDDDRNVDFAETISLYRALDEAKVPVAAYVLPNEVHSFLRFSSWTQVIEQTAGFLQMHLEKPGIQ